MTITGDGNEVGIWDDATSTFTPWPGGIEGEPRPYSEAEVTAAAQRAAEAHRAELKAAILAQVGTGLTQISTAQGALRRAIDKPTALTVAEWRQINNQHLNMARILEKVVRVVANLVEEV